jgi:hypothetical protein
MQSKIFIFVLIVILIIILGCQRKGVGEKSIEEDFHKGTRGLEMDFIKNAPPDRVYVGDELEITVELRNEGAYPTSDIFEGKLEITGFDPAAIDGYWDGGKYITNKLQGRSQYIPEGGYTTMTFRDDNGVDVPFDVDRYEPEILVTSCYRYKTIADPVVCIDPDPFRPVQEEKVCEINDQSFGGSWGAPVSFPRIEEEVTRDKIIFRIYVNNVGNGQVIESTAFNDCPFDIEHDEIDKVIVRAKLPFDSNPECNPRGTAADPVRLNDGRGFIFCTFNKPNTDSAFETTLHLEAEYVYSSSISKKIEIINLR